MGRGSDGGGSGNSGAERGVGIGPGLLLLLPVDLSVGILSFPVFGTSTNTSSANFETTTTNI